MRCAGEYVLPFHGLTFYFVEGLLCCITTYQIESRVTVLGEERLGVEGSSNMEKGLMDIDDSVVIVLGRRV